MWDYNKYLSGWYGVGVIAVLTSLFLTGCSNGLSNDRAPLTNSNSSVTPNSSCSFDNQTFASGSTITGYSAQNVAYGSSCSAVVETVTCTNGVLSPSNAFGSCSVAAAISCNFNGSTVASGSSLIAYQSSTVPYGSTCVSQSRTCTNGVLSGTYTASTCAVGVAATCTFNGQTMTNGGTTTGYATSTVPYGQTCTSKTVTCNNGTLSPPNAYGSCSVAQPATCNFDGQTLAGNGGSAAGYATSTVPYGQSCTRETVTCNNGMLSPANAYATCSINPPASCVFGGQTIAGGAAVMGYSVATVPYGSSCTPKEIGVSCNNGVLSPANAFATCAAAAPSSCIFNGQTLASGGTAQGYSTSSVAFGTSCASVAETVSCLNGVLNPAKASPTCVVGPAAPCTFGGKTLLGNGGTASGFTSSSVPFGQTCLSETVTCSNGVLNPANAFATCAPLALNPTVPNSVISAGVTAVSVGFEHVCAIVSGALKCWGDNTYGQLGNGTTTASKVPITIIPSGVTAVSATQTHTCAIVNGAVYCWGYNGLGEIGNGTTNNASLPVKVIASGATAITTGDDNSCATVAGQAECWGSNYEEQLGFSNVAGEENSPFAVYFYADYAPAIQLSAGGDDICGIFKGALYCQGDNTYQQIGVNSSMSYLPFEQSTPTLPSGVTNVSVSGNDTCAIVGGALKCWGDNYFGQMGNGTTTTAPLPITLFSSGVTAVSAGFDHTCALVHGALECWGSNVSGELGVGTTSLSSKVPLVVIPTGVTSFSAGRSNTCAIIGDALKCWGDDTYGQLGVGQ